MATMVIEIEEARIGVPVPGGGFEPPFTGPKPVVLPLDDPGALQLITRMRERSSFDGRGLQTPRQGCDTRATERCRSVLVSDKHKYPEWFLWFVDHGVRILILVAIALLAFAFARSRSNTEERLHAIEDTVQYEPARAYQAPNLDDYASNVSTSSLPVKRAVYIPAYSHIYYDGGRPYLLETTLSIRNVDPQQPVYLSVVEYYNTEGKLTKKLVDRLIQLAPLQTIEFLIERRDASGGSGANFIVVWHAASTEVHAPLVEAVMVGRSGTNAISFVRKSEPLPQWVSE